MSKHHIEKLAEQIANKGHASVPFHREKMSYFASEIAKSEDGSTKAADENSSMSNFGHVHQVYK